MDWVGQIPTKPRALHNELDLKELGLEISSLSLEQKQGGDSGGGEEHEDVLGNLLRDVAMPLLLAGQGEEPQDSILQRARFLMSSLSVYDRASPENAFISRDRSHVVAMLFFNQGQLAYFMVSPAPSQARHRSAPRRWKIAHARHVR